MAEEYEKLCKEKKAPKKVEMKVMDEDRTYVALLNVLEEYMENAGKVVEDEDEETSMDKVRLRLSTRLLRRSYCTWRRTRW